MAASTEQKLDYLLKKIGYTASKTGLAEDSSLSGTKKAPFAEAIPSPLVTPSTTIWNESALIPTTPPGSDTAQVRVYLAGTSGHRMTVDSTVSGSRAFIAYSTYNNTSTAILGDWIDPQFGDSYIIKVYKGDPNSGGVLLSAAGAGSNDTWFFDYSSGVLNFNGTVIPSGVTDNNIYVVGYRYIGVKGIATAGITTSGTSTFKDLNVTGVSTFAGNINANGNIIGDNSTNITGIAGVTATTLTGTLQTAAQTNITSVGTLDALTVSGNVNANGNIVGDNSTNISGISSVTATSLFGALTGTLQTAAQPNITSVGTLTSLNVTGDVSIGGTLTYEDVTNIDSVGLITARTGIKVLAGGINAVGVVTATSFDGSLATTNLTGTITNAQLAGSIANDKLANSTVSYGGVSLALGETDATPAFNLTDATNYPFTSLTGITTTILGDATPKLGGDLNGNGKSIFNVGIITATTFSGDISGVGATFTNITGTLQTAAQPNITSLGTLGALTVSGNINANGNIVGDNATNISGINSVTATTYFGDGTKLIGVSTAGISTEGTTTLNNLEVAGISTFAGLAKFNGNFEAAGNVTLGDGTGDNIDVQGRFVRELVPSSNGNKDLGTSSFRWGTLHVKNILQSGGGISTFTNDIGVDGTSTLNNVNVSGVSTFVDDIKINNINKSLQVGDITNDNYAQLSQVNVSSGTSIRGFDTTYDNASVLDNLQGSLNQHIILGDTGNTNGDTLFGVSISNSSGAFFKQLSLSGTGDLNVANNITGVGATFTNIKGTLQTAAQPNITSLGTLTSLDVSGDVSIGGTLTYEDVTNIDSLGIITARTGIKVLAGGIDAVGVVTASGGVRVNADGTTAVNYISVGANDDLKIYHHSSGVSQIHNSTGYFEIQANTVSWIKTTQFNVIDNDATRYHIRTFKNDRVELYNNNVKRLETTASGVDITDTLNVAGVSTFTGNIDANGDLDVDGHTELDNVNVSGVSTFNNTVHLPANVQLRFDSNNTTDSLRIFDDNGNSRFISDHGIFFGTDSTWAVLNESQTTFKIKAGPNDVLLYHGGSERVATTNTGVVVTGILTATSFSGDGSNLSNIGFTTSVGTFNASSGVATIDSFAHATEDYKVAEYTLHFTNGSNIQAQKLLVMQDGTTAYSQEFAVMSSASQLVTVDAAISGANVLVRATPEIGISGTTTFRWRRIVQE